MEHSSVRLADPQVDGNQLGQPEAGSARLESDHQYPPPFDVIAIQEVKGDLRALRDTMHFLGNDWAFLMTDVNIGDAEIEERFAFIFDRSRL